MTLALEVSLVATRPEVVEEEVDLARVHPGRFLSVSFQLLSWTAYQDQCMKCVTLCRLFLSVMMDDNQDGSVSREGERERKKKRERTETGEKLKF